MKLVQFLCLLVCVIAGVNGTRWEEVGRPQSDKWIPLRFALNQQNLDVLEATLLDVSDPHSKNYGKWWTASEVLDLVAPSAEISESVVRFLKSKGARAVENHRDMVKFEMKVGDIEEIFRTSLNIYEDLEGQKSVIRTRSGYTLPSEIARHVSLISGLREFPTLNRKEPISSYEREARGVEAQAKEIVTIGHLQTLYGVPSSFPVNSQSSLCLAEFADYSAFAPDDLTLFAQEMGIPDINVVQVLGLDNFTNPGLESSLDIQYGGGLAINTSIWFWTLAGWQYEFATDLQAMSSPPLVVSISWLSAEPENCDGDNSPACSDGSMAYTERVSNEFQKIGLQGITLVAASGDQGAPGTTNPNCADPNTPNMTVPLSTAFPASSPWVLAVGATMLLDSDEDIAYDPQNPPICNDVPCATSTTEGVCTWPNALITSGGGFSNFLTQQSYQSSVVNSYLSSGVALPPSNLYNTSNRAYPDVAALGHNYYIAALGNFTVVDGTSASTPVLAAMISLLNSYRLNNGKGSLGFVNPLFYAAYASDSSTFNDITSGNNKCTESCCGKVGYEATKGWDPVTGLGTPNFQKLLTYVSNLQN